jgi:hypothetical protein
VRENAGRECRSRLRYPHEFSVAAAQTYGAVSQIDHGSSSPSIEIRDYPIEIARYKRFFPCRRIRDFLCNIFSFVFNDCHCVQASPRDMSATEQF